MGKINLKLNIDKKEFKEKLNIKDGKDGKDGLDGKDGRDGSEDTGAEIVKKINDISPSGPLIDASHIGNLTALVVKRNQESGSSGHTIQDEGVSLTARTKLNFVGAGVTVTDGGAVTDDTIVTIPTPTVPVKATGAEINTGTNDDKFATAKAIADSNIAFVNDVKIMQGTFDLTAQYQVDTDLWLLDLHADQFPYGIYITKVYVDCTVADPTTELNANLMYCDAVAGGAFPGANATLIKAIDTTTGNFADAAVNTAVATGKSIYIDMDADPTDADTQWHIRIHYYIAAS